MTLKKILLASVAIVSVSVAIHADPPTVMFLPDKTWCVQNNYVDVKERNGKTTYTEKFEEAFVKDPALKGVIVQLNALIGDSGIKAKDFGTSSELDDEEESEMALYEDEDGGAIEMTDYEMALSKLRPDIIIKVGWDKNTVGFNYTLSYRLEALDSYSGKSIAQVTGVTPSKKTTYPVGEALQAAAREHMPLFVSRLQEHFDDLQANGREVTLACRVAGGSGTSMNTDMNGNKLSEVITQWVSDNTVNHAYSTRQAGRNAITFEQVRIPFKDANGANNDAIKFVNQLERYLKNTYGITAENTTKGLGSGRLFAIKAN